MLLSWGPDGDRVTLSVFIGVCFPSDTHTLIKQRKGSILLFYLFIRGAPGKSGLHASGEGERVIAPEPW